MPRYDSVLGAQFDTTGVAATERASVDELLETARSNSGDLAVSDRQDVLDEVRAISGVKAELVIEVEDGGRYLLVIEGGKEHTYDLRDSRQADRVEAPHGTYEPAIQSNGPIDDVLDMLRESGIEDVRETDENATKLPYRWSGRDEMMTALATIGPLLRDEAVCALVEIDGRRYDVELADAQVTSLPLFSLAETPELTRRANAIAGLAVRDDVATRHYAKPTRRKPAPAYDRERPLTTGTLRQREDAWFALTHSRKPKPDLLPIIMAVGDDANRDSRYAELRREMYHYLAKHDTAEVRDVFLWALREEDDEMAKTVTYVGWRLDLLIAALGAEMLDAEVRGDKRTLSRMKKLKAEAGISD